MRVALFYHTVRSDWNHGHSHFLRGLVRALQTLGHDAVVYEEAGNWSVTNLVHDHGLRPLVEFRRRFPFIKVRLYQSEPRAALEHRLLRELSGVDVVVIDEWPAVENPALTELLIRLRPICGYALLLRDAHSRILTETAAAYPGLAAIHRRLDRFDAILVYGPSMADEYRSRFGLRVFVVHEAADVALFCPPAPGSGRPVDDAVFIGNWGDGNREGELRQFLLRPAQRFRPERLVAVHGVRYPAPVLATLERDYGVEYRGWLPNYLVPQAFAQARVGLHLMRRQYAERLHGIPTIRVFETLACSLPLVSTRWQDTDHLFRQGTDYVMVDTPKQMEEALDWLWHDDDARARLARNGLLRIRGAQTCLHRAEQLLGIVARLRAPHVTYQTPGTRRAPSGEGNSAAALEVAGAPSLPGRRARE